MRLLFYFFLLILSRLPVSAGQSSAEVDSGLLRQGEACLMLDNRKALTILEPLAEKGNSKAIELVFSIYLSWYEMELALGEQLSLKHQTKFATTRDKLFYFARKGFLNNPKRFADELGVCYWLGAGVKRDRNTAIELIKRCENPMNQLAGYFLGQSIMYGTNGCVEHKGEGLSILSALPDGKKSFFSAREAVKQILFSFTDPVALQKGEDLLLDNTIHFPQYGTDFLSLYAYLYIVPELGTDNSDKWFSAAQHAGIGIFSLFMEKQESRAISHPERRDSIRYYIEQSLQSADSYIIAVALAKKATYVEHGAFGYTKDTQQLNNTLRQLARTDLFKEAPYYFPGLAYQLYASAATAEEKEEALLIAQQQDETHPLLTLQHMDSLLTAADTAAVIQKLQELKSSNQNKQLCVLSMYSLYSADIINLPAKRLKLCAEIRSILSGIDDADVSLVLGCICMLEENLLAYDKEVKNWQQYAETLQSHAIAGISESAHKCAHAYAAALWGFPRDMEKAIHYARLAKENMHESGPVFLMAVYLYAASGYQNSALFLKEAADSEEFETYACMLLLADYYHRSADSTQRRYWLQKAAELGSVEAEKLLRLWNILQ